MDPSTAFVQRTVSVAPGLEAIYRDHVAFYEQVIAHVYFSEISEWLVNQVAEHKTSGDVAALLELFEVSYPTADHNVQNLIDVSFVENVQDEPNVVRLLGPTLLSRVDPECQPS